MMGGNMGYEGMAQTDHEGPRMLPEPSDELVDEQAHQS